MGAANCTLAKVSRCAVATTVMLATACAYAADVRIAHRGQSGRSASARLAISVIVVPIIESPQLPQPQSRKAAVAFQLEDRPSSQRARTSEKTFSLDSHSAAVLKTLTIVPE